MTAITVTDKKCIIPAAEIELGLDGRTIYVHTPNGNTALRIVATEGVHRMQNEVTARGPSFCDIQVQGRVLIGLGTDVFEGNDTDYISDTQRMEMLFDLSFEDDTPNAPESKLTRIRRIVDRVLRKKLTITKVGGQNG